MEHDDLNKLLRRRALPPQAGVSLAERIIHAAVTALPPLPRRETFWADLWGMFALPHPSVAIAAGVILGLVMGLQAGDGLTSMSQDWSSFLDINEGGWL